MTEIYMWLEYNCYRKGGKGTTHCGMENYFPTMFQMASNWTLAIIAVERFLTVW